MADRPGDVKKKLDELYRQTEDIRRNLIDIHHMLTNTGYFDEARRYQKPQPEFVPPIIQEVIQPPVPEQVFSPQPEPVQFKAPEPVKHIAPPSPPKPPKPGFFERNPDLEKFIGERLVTFIGIAILFTGIAFFVKYAIDKNWINEIGRTAIGILCGGVLIGVAHRLRKSYTTFSSVLAGGGVAVLYFAVSYAFQVYHLFSQSVTLGILVAITSFTVLLSIAYNRKELAILAIVGGFASPLMVKTGEGNFTVLCIYMLILDVGMLVLAFYKKWNVVSILAFVFTILFFVGSLNNDIGKNGHAHDGIAMLFATLFYFTFFAMNIVNNLIAKRKFEAYEIISMLTNTGLYYGAGYFLLGRMDLQHITGIFTLLVAAFNAVFAFGLFRRQEVDKTLIYFLIGIVITFVSLAAPVQLSGNHITLFWAAEAVLLLWLYKKSELKVIKVFSSMLNAVLVLSVLYNWMNVYLLAGPEPTTALMNKGFITTMGAVLSLVATAFLLDKSKEEYVFGSWLTSDYRKLISTTALIVLFTGGLFELVRQLIEQGYYAQGIIVVASTYVLLFVIAAWYNIAIFRMEFLRITLRIILFGMMLMSILIPHVALVAVRDAYLLGTENSLLPFLLHYVHTAALLFTGFMLLRNIFADSSIPKPVRNTYLWVFTIVGVYVLSAELDHLLVMAYTDSPISPLWSMNEVRANINSGLAFSHKVGFPIIWGICSFALMFVGMKRKNRQVRIISLALFFITVVKLILLGVYGESQTGKIIAFILCGVILLLVSFMYQKLKKIILDDHTAPDLTKQNENAE